MAQHELNEGLAAHIVRPGDPPLNSTGAQGSRELRSINRDIKELFFRKGDEPCDLPRHVHQTWMEALVDTTWALAVGGDKDARKDLMNRCFGRVPLSVDASLTMQRQDPLGDMTEEQLIARSEKLIAILKTQRPIDGEVVRDEDGEPPADDPA